MRDNLDNRLLAVTGSVIVGFIGTAALLVTVLEKPWTSEAFGESLYWATNTVLGSGDPGYVASPAGWLLSWALILLSLTLLAIATGALVTFMVDVAMKEGRGMGASGFSDHIVVCGWNPSARELIEELQGDEYQRRVSLICSSDTNPAGNGVYFVSGDPTQRDDLMRAGVEEAAAASSFPPTTPTRPTCARS